MISRSKKESHKEIRNFKNLCKKIQNGYYDITDIIWDNLINHKNNDIIIHLLENNFQKISQNSIDKIIKYSISNNNPYIMNVILNNISSFDKNTKKR